MAGLISPATLEQIRAANDIVEVVGSYLPLKRAGANFVALCPFHREKTPSFNVNPQKQIFHCFGCHKGGDVFTFVKEHENIGFMDAVRRLAERAKIPLEFEKSPAEQQSRHLKERLLQIHEQITQRWQSALANEAAGQVARDYLAKRGVGAEAVKLFRLGCAPDLWDDTVNWARSKGHELGLVEKAGLVLRKEGGENYYDRFRGRLMFPICDEQGRVIGFSGRILSGDEKTAKYVNSPETAIFTKSKVFFGLDKAKRAVLDAQYAIVCEGQLDLIACYMAGVQNVVAPQGTALTADHTRILKRYADEVVLCFDSDEAGQNAAVRSLDHLLASGLAVRVAVVPAPHDPDSFIKKSGGAAFQELINDSQGFFDYYLNRLCTMHDAATDKGRIAVLKGMADAVYKTGNVVLIDTHAQKTALRLGVSPEAVRAEFKKLAAKTHGLSEAERGIEADISLTTARPSPEEGQLLKLALSSTERAAWVAAHLRPDWLAHAVVQRVLTRLFRAQADGAWNSTAGFVTEFVDDPSAQQLVTEALAEVREIPHPETQLADILRGLRNQDLTSQIAALKQRMAQTGVELEEQRELNRRITELRQMKRQPLGAAPGAGEAGA
jgi:DNA primase